MADGPGGREVSRVSARVVPDTSGLRRQLLSDLEKIERGLTVTVKVVADTRGLAAEVRGALAGLDEKITVTVDADTSQAAAKTKLFVDDTNGADATVDVDADTTGAKNKTDALIVDVNTSEGQIKVTADTGGVMVEVNRTVAQINAKRATIKVSIDNPGLGGLGGGGRGGIFGALTSALSSIPSMAIAAAGALASLGSGAVSAFGGALSGANGLLNALGSSIPVIGQFVGAIAQVGLSVGVIGAAVGIIGGGLLSALGAVSAAVAPLPALLLGAGAAAGVVALGMDGIKRAAQEAVPGLNRLKTEVSEVFAQQLAPVFRDLGERVFPQLSFGLQELAMNTGGFASGLLAVVTNADGLNNVNAIFDNMGRFLITIMPSLQGLLAVFLEIGATEGVWRLLADTINIVTSRVAELFARFADSSSGVSLMERSLAQFNGVLDAVLGLINELIIGATEFFTAAGPGLRDMLNDIAGVVKNIDFTTLGSAFGTFARAVGDFIASVPQSVWDNIASAVQRLAEQFAAMSQDPAMQTFFAALINLIPIVIDAFTGFLKIVQFVVGGIRGFIGGVIGAIATGAEAINTFVQAMPGIPDSVRGAVALSAGALRGLSDSFNTELPAAAATIPTHTPAFTAGGTALGNAVNEGGKAGMAGFSVNMGAAAGAAVTAVQGNAEKARGAGAAVGGGAFEGVRSGVAPMVPETGNRTTEAIGKITAEVGAAQGAGNQVGGGAAGGARDGMAPMPDDMGRIAVDSHGRVAGERYGFEQAGADVAAGTAAGISSGKSAVISAAIAIANAAWQAAKSFLGIASPSKLFRDSIGVQVPAGFAAGITAGAPIAVAAATGMANRVAAATSQSLDPALKAAAQELLARLNSGGQIFEDLTFRGMSSNLGRFNDQLMDMLDASGKSLRDFLTGLANSSGAVQAGQTIGKQIVQGMDKVLKPYTIEARTPSSTAGKLSNAYDYVTDQARAAWQPAIWSGLKPGHPGSGGAPPSTSAADFQNMTWSVELDPEGMAKITAKGNRTLARR